MSVIKTTIRNPFEPDIRVVDEMDYIPGKPLSYYVSDIPFCADDLIFVIALNGWIKEYENPEDLSDIVTDESSIVVTAKTGVTVSSAIAAMVTSIATSPAVMGIGGSFMGLMGAGMTAAAMIYGGAFLGSMFAIGYGVSKLLSAMAPDMPGDTSAEDIYGWGALTQTNQEGLAIPYLYGTCKVSGNVINQFTTVDENDDEILHVLLGICDHEVDSISDIRINDQPHTFYDGVEVYTRLGTNNNAEIPGFDEIIDQTDVGSKISYGATTTKRTNGDCEKINVRISLPKGLYYLDTDGKPSTLYAACSVKYKPVASSTYITHSVLVCGPVDMVKAGVDTFGFSGEIVDAKNEFGVKYIFDESMIEDARQGFVATNSGFFATSDSADSGSIDSKVYEVVIDGLDLGQYDFQISRINPEWEGLKESADTYLQSYQEVIKQSLIYPGIAMYAITALATDQLSGSAPSFSCLATNASVGVYNPATETWSEQPADNIAWVVYDLIVNRAGRPTGKIIYDEFTAFAAHIIEHEIKTGLYLTGSNNSNFWAEVQRIAAIGRGAVVQRGAKYGIFVDNAFTGTVPHVFNSANIIEGSLRIEWLEKSDIANAVEVEYTDPDRDHTRQVATIISDDYLAGDDVSSKATIQIEAAVHQQVAIDYGVFLINCNKHLTKSITFDAFVDSFGCTVGDLFFYQQEVPNSEDCYTGRIVDAGSDDGDGNPYITLDKPVSLEGGSTYYALVRLQDGTFSEKQILGVSTKENSLTLTTPWATAPSQFDIYSVGTQVEIKKKYRLTSITRQDDFVRTITGLEYIDDIYTDRSGTIIEEPTWERVTQEALNVGLFESLAYSADGSYKSILTVKWSSSLGSYDQRGWDVWLKNVRTGTTVMVVGDFKRHNCTINTPLVVGGTYKVFVVPSSQGISDTGGNTATITILGKLAPPSNVTGFTGAWDAMKRQVHFAWDTISDIDLLFYEIREGNTFSDGEKISEVVGSSKSIFINEGVSENITYWIAAKDDSGIYSADAAGVTVGINTSDCNLSIPGGLGLTSTSSISPDGTDVVTLSAVWNTNAETSDEFWRYEFWRYEIWLEEISIGKFSEFATEKSEYQWSVKPNVDYGVAVRAVDKSGNYTDFCTQVTLLTAKDATPPSAPSWPASLDIIPGFKLVGLNWNDVSESDLSHYVFERSTTGAWTGEQFESGAIDASYTTDTQLAVGESYCYRVKAVDTSGNESEWSPTRNTTTLQVGSSDIAYNAIIANHIMVSNLAAISANIGTITAGKLQNAAGTSYLDLTNNLMALGDKLTYNGVDLSIDATVVFGSGSSGIANLSDAGDLATKNRSDLNYHDGADVTGNNTAFDTTFVAGTSANTVKTNAANGATFTNLSYLDYGKVNGTKPPADADKTANNSAGGLITGADISYAKANGQTLISGGYLNTNILKVGSAQIDNLAVTNAKIGNLQVGTTKLADNAATVPVSAYSAGPVSCTANSWTIVQTCTLTGSGAPMLIHASLWWPHDYEIEVAINLQYGASETTIYGPVTINDGATPLVFSCNIVDTPSSGLLSYHLYVNRTGATTLNAYNRSLSVLETKK